MASFIMGVFLFALDTTILADIQPQVLEEINAVDKVAWISVAYRIPTAALMLPNGQFSQSFNVKWLYIFGVGIFEAGSALCGAAPNVTVFICARAVAGLGTTFIYSCSLVLVTMSTNQIERLSVKMKRLICQGHLYGIHVNGVRSRDGFGTGYWRESGCE
jgi:MFS family permease